MWLCVCLCLFLTLEMLPLSTPVLLLYLMFRAGFKLFRIYIESVSKELNTCF